MPHVNGIIPVLTYRDIAAAHDFLVEAFGFDAGGVHRTRDPEGHRWWFVAPVSVW